MNIIAQNFEKLDDTIYENKRVLPLKVARVRETRDGPLALELQKDPNYMLIRIDERTIISSIGNITFKRRYYYDKFQDKYIYPLDLEMNIPRYSQFTNKLRLEILCEAPKQSYANVCKTLAFKNINITKTTVFNTVK